MALIVNFKWKNGIKMANYGFGQRFQDSQSHFPNIPQKPGSLVPHICVTLSKTYFKTRVLKNLQKIITRVS